MPPKIDPNDTNKKKKDEKSASASSEDSKQQANLNPDSNSKTLGAARAPLTNASAAAPAEPEPEPDENDDAEQKRKAQEATESAKQEQREKKEAEGTSTAGAATIDVETTTASTNVNTPTSSDNVIMSAGAAPATETSPRGNNTQGKTKMTTQKTPGDAEEQVKLRLEQLCALADQDDMVNKAQSTDNPKKQQENGNRLTVINTILRKIGVNTGDNPLETDYANLDLANLDISNVNIERARQTLSSLTLYETAWVRRTLGGMYGKYFHNVSTPDNDSTKITNENGDVVITTGSSLIGTLFFGANLRNSTTSFEGCLVNLAASMQTLANLRAKEAADEVFHPTPV